MSTVLEQREVYASLVPAWNGALERSGEVPGLSTYKGRSSIYHSVNWEQSEEYERRKELRNDPNHVPTVRKLSAWGRAVRAINRSNDAQILQRLKFGYSYNDISREMGVSVSVIRRVAKENKIDRSQFQGAGWWKNR